MTTALLTTFIFFYLFGQSLNIITLSGLILAVGMMIDSAIIVTDIISQYRMQGYSLEEACIKGTNEVITPVLSSTLTTIAVFVPLVFMSGIAGAIFFAQAFAVSIGLLVSYFTGIILLPVLYRVIYGIRTKGNRLSDFFGRTQKRSDKVVFKGYDEGISWVFRHKKLTYLFAILSIPLCILIFRWIPRSSMPHLDHSESVVRVDWNENIHVDENRARVDELLKNLEDLTTENAAYIGHRQYLLEKASDLTPSECQLYLRVPHSSDIDDLHDRINKWIAANHPSAILTFSPPENIFEKIFDTSVPDLSVRLFPADRTTIPNANAVRNIEQKLSDITHLKAEGIAMQQQFNLTVDNEKLLLYGVSYDEVYRILRTAFRDNLVTTLRSFQQYLPITLTGPQQTVEEVLRKTLITINSKVSGPDTEARSIPLSALVNLSAGEDLKSIVAGKDGEYIPFNYYEVSNPGELMEQISELVREDNEWEADFAGSYFTNKEMLGEMVVILLVSLLLMYFILSAQFEDFLQPLIVLTEIPIDFAFALLILWISGHTLNLMSAIGLIVSGGIIINDSILKLDMINELRKQGVPLYDAIHTAGHKRLRAIIMTTLTSILAMVPLLFSFDMGSELQKPLAVGMISTMLVGMLVSLFVVPLIYWTIYRKRESITKRHPSSTSLP